MYQRNYQRQTGLVVRYSSANTDSDLSVAGGLCEKTKANRGVRLTPEYFKLRQSQKEALFGCGFYEENTEAEVVPVI